jgi:hypothetical protein
LAIISSTTGVPAATWSVPGSETVSDQTALGRSDAASKAIPAP